MLRWIPFFVIMAVAFSWVSIPSTALAELTCEEFFQPTISNRLAKVPRESSLRRAVEDMVAQLKTQDALPAYGTSLHTRFWDYQKDPRLLEIFSREYPDAFARYQELVEHRLDPRTERFVLNVIQEVATRIWTLDELPALDTPLRRRYLEARRIQGFEHWFEHKEPVAYSRYRFLIVREKENEPITRIVDEVAAYVSTQRETPPASSAIWSRFIRHRDDPAFDLAFRKRHGEIYRTYQEIIKTPAVQRLQEESIRKVVDEVAERLNATGETPEPGTPLYQRYLRVRNEKYFDTYFSSQHAPAHGRYKARLKMAAELEAMPSLAAEVAELVAKNQIPSARNPLAQRFARFKNRYDFQELFRRQYPQLFDRYLTLLTAQARTNFGIRRVTEEVEAYLATTRQWPDPKSALGMRLSRVKDDPRFQVALRPEPLNDPGDLQALRSRLSFHVDLKTTTTVIAPHERQIELRLVRTDGTEAGYLVYSITQTASNYAQARIDFSGSTYQKAGVLNFLIAKMIETHPAIAQISATLGNVNLTRFRAARELNGGDLNAAGLATPIGIAVSRQGFTKAEAVPQDGSQGELVDIVFSRQP